MRCCSLIQDIIIGIVPTEVVEPVVYNIYTAELTIVDFLDTLVMGALGSVSGVNAPTLIGGIQAVFQDAGGGAVGNLTKYFIWIKSEGEPVGWTWNGNPVTWNDQGLAVLKSCQTTGTVAIDTSLYYFRYVIFYGNGPEEINGGLAYNNGAFEATFLTNCIMFFGTNTTVSTTITATDIDLTVYNTYATITAITSDDFVNPVQQDPVTLCP